MSDAVAITGGCTVVPDGAALPTDGVPPALRERVSRVERLSALALLAAAGALATSGGDERSARERTGVVLGTAFGCFLTNAEYERRFAAGGAAAASPRLFAATVSNAAAGEVAIAFGLAGPGITLTAGGASGTVALAHAASVLDRDEHSEADVILAGGVDALGAPLSAWVDAGGLAVGGPLGEAATLLVLEPLLLARRRGATVRGTILGHAVGFEPAAQASDAGAGLGAAIERAVHRSGVAADEIRAVVSTARTPLAACEARALAGVFGARLVPRRPSAADAPDVLGAAGPRAVLHALAAEPAGTTLLVLDACTSGHVVAMVVRSGASG